MSDQLKELSEAIGLLEARAQELRLLANELARIQRERNAAPEAPPASEPPRGDALPRPVVCQRVSRPPSEG